MPRRAAGAGSLRQLPSGSWNLTGRYQGIRYSVTGATQQAALREQGKRLAEIDAGQHAARTQRERLAGAVSTWLESKRPPGVGYATWQRYVLAGRHLCDPEWGDLADVPLRELGRSWAPIRAAYRRLAQELSASSLHQCHVVLSGSLALAAEDGQAVPPLPKSVRPPRVQTVPIEVPDPADVEAVIRHSVGLWRPLWRLMAHTGLRLGEALALRWRDIGVDSVTVVQALEEGPGYLPRIKPFPKTGKSGIRTIPVVADVLTAVRALPERGSLVFASSHGTPLRKSNAIRALKDGAERAGLERAAWHPHLLRHLAASIWLQSREHSIQEVAYLLGHASPEVTLRIYAHVVGRDVSTAHQTMARVYGGATITNVSRTGSNGAEQRHQHTTSGAMTNAEMHAAPSRVRTG